MLHVKLSQHLNINKRVIQKLFVTLNGINIYAIETIHIRC